jgi:hypothetical protein
VPRGDRPDEEEPVRGDERCRDQEGEEGAVVPERGADLSEAPAPGEPGQEERHGPDDPVGEDLFRRHPGDRLEVEDREAPGEIGGHSVGQAQPCRVRRAGRVRSGLCLLFEGGHWGDRNGGRVWPGRPGDHAPRIAGPKVFTTPGRAGTPEYRASRGRSDPPGNLSGAR